MTMFCHFQRKSENTNIFILVTSSSKILLPAQMQSREEMKSSPFLHIKFCVHEKERKREEKEESRNHVFARRENHEWLMTLPHFSLSTFFLLRCGTIGGRERERDNERDITRQREREREYSPKTVSLPQSKCSRRTRQWFEEGWRFLEP